MDIVAQRAADNTLCGRYGWCGISHRFDLHCSRSWSSRSGHVRYVSLLRSVSHRHGPVFTAMESSENFSMAEKTRKWSLDNVHGHLGDSSNPIFIFIFMTNMLSVIHLFWNDWLKPFVGYIPSEQRRTRESGSMFESLTDKSRIVRQRVVSA